MTNYFNFKRFLLLVKKQGIENIKLYLLCSVALAFILSFVFIFWRLTSHNEFHEEGIYITYIFGLIIAGALFASFSFQQLSTKDKAIYYISFPASRIEKLAVVLFYNIVVFTLAYSLIFYIIKTIFWEYIKSLAAADPKEYHIYYLHWENGEGFVNVFPYLFFVYLAIQSFYILGSIYFTRFAFIKTTIAGSILIFLFVWFMNQLMRGELTGFEPSGSVTLFENGGERKVYELPAFVSTTVKYAAQMIWAPVFFLVTYFRLKEKQV